MAVKTMLTFLFFAIVLGGAIASATLLFEGKDSDASEAGLYTILTAGGCVYFRNEFVSEDDDE